MFEYDFIVKLSIIIMYNIFVSTALIRCVQNKFRKIEIFHGNLSNFDNVL